MAPSVSSSSKHGGGGTVTVVALLASAVAIGAGATALAYHNLLPPDSRTRGEGKNGDEGEESSPHDDDDDRTDDAAKTIERLTELRSAERRGRIRAEIRLRDALREVERMRLLRGEGEEDGAAAVTAGEGAGGGTDEDPADDDDAAAANTMKLRCIGVMRTPFPKRMGTPRQGALVPDSRGYLQLFPRICPPECLDGIDSYSHLWIIFAFHANTDLPSPSSQSKNRRTKIRPPRAPKGVRVGQLATRSPHRPNPLGLSLVRIEGFDHKSKRLHVSALDLVDGTPVYDVKPFVPWDVPGHRYRDDVSTTPEEALEVGSSVRVPPWVSGRDDVVDLDDVTFDTYDVEEELRKLVVDRNKLEPLYSGPEGFEMAKSAIREVLAQDPRASHRRGDSTEDDDPYRLVFGRVLVEFAVRKRRRRHGGDENASEGGGPSSSSSSSRGEDDDDDIVVVITGVTGVDFDNSSGDGGGAISGTVTSSSGVPLAEDIIADDR